MSTTAPGERAHVRRAHPARALRGDAVIVDLRLGAYAALHWVGPALLAAGGAAIAVLIVLNRRLP